MLLLVNIYPEIYRIVQIVSFLLQYENVGISASFFQTGQCHNIIPLVYLSSGQGVGLVQSLLPAWYRALTPATLRPGEKGCVKPLHGTSPLMGYGWGFREIITKTRGGTGIIPSPGLV